MQVYIIASLSMIIHRMLSLERVMGVRGLGRWEVL